MTPDPHDLDRFVQAQNRVMPDVEAELRAGRKRTHWMWFVFPQLRGLGHSPTARHYAIASRAEAAAYLAHPTLGRRLRDCTALATAAVPNQSAHAIFGTPDDLKFHSCLTLFHAVAPADPTFAQALARFFANTTDPRTTALLETAD